VTRGFVISIIGATFASVPLDQQNAYTIKNVKGPGGFSGIAHDPRSLRRLTIVGPEITRMVQEFNNDLPKENKHHKVSLSFQKQFISNVQVSRLCPGRKGKSISIGKFVSDFFTKPLDF
jgi:hypothetical protein